MTVILERGDPACPKRSGGGLLDDFSYVALPLPFQEGTGVGPSRMGPCGDVPRSSDVLSSVLGTGNK